jgi:hypothetical protein
VSAAKKPRGKRAPKASAEQQAEALNAKPASSGERKARVPPEIVIYVPEGAEQKRRRGRPTDYKPSMCELVEELGKAGKSRAQIAAALDVAIKTTREWEEVHPEFRSAMSRARDYALAWWEEAGQAGMFMMGFNATAWSLQVRNRFPDDYRDRREVEHSGTVQHEARVSERAERLRMVRDRRSQVIDVEASDAPAERAH